MNNEPEIILRENPPTCAKNTKNTENTENIRAAVLPHAGMTLRSLTRGNIEVICQTRAPEFAACRKGYGPLIGPHFNQRPQLPDTVTKNMTRWPQAPTLAAMGVRDCWQHGVGRYVPWEYTATPDSIRATLSGTREFQGVPLRDIQGGDFEMRLEMHVANNALHIHYTAEASFPPVVGLHYYYDLPGDAGRVRAKVAKLITPNSQASPIPAEWMQAGTDKLNLPLRQPLDHKFALLPGPVELQTAAYTVVMTPIKGVDSLIVFHPDNNGWVCVEPLAGTNSKDNCQEMHIKLEIACNATSGNK